MGSSGATIENPVSGESITWRTSTAESGGALLAWEHALRPGARVPFDHVHPRQEERFEVLAGPVRFRVGDDLRDLEAGDRLTVPAGVPHGFRNPADHEVRVSIELRPPRSTEQFFERSFALARAGRVTRRGVPGVFANALLLAEDPDLAVLPGTPLVAQRIAIPVLARVARILGVRVPDRDGRVP
jgi:quercetin dioxygenase-like cupin family protein